MLYVRNGHVPRIDPSAVVAPGAVVAGNVEIGPGCYVDHGAVVASAGPLVELGERVAVMAGAVVRSVGGTSRPAYPVRLGSETLVSPLAALAGCTVEPRCYIATGAIVFHGAVLGEGTRVGAGGIVHAGARVPPRAHVGMRCFAVPAPDGCLVTADVEVARAHVAKADFFAAAFDAHESDPAALHAEAVRLLLEEALAWRDELVTGGGGEPRPASNRS